MYQYVALVPEATIFSPLIITVLSVHRVNYETPLHDKSSTELLYVPIVCGALQQDSNFLNCIMVFTSLWFWRACRNTLRRARIQHPTLKHLFFDRKNMLTQGTRSLSCVTPSSTDPSDSTEDFPRTNDIDATCE